MSGASRTGGLSLATRIAEALAGEPSYRERIDLRPGELDGVRRVGLIADTHGLLPHSEAEPPAKPARARKSWRILVMDDEEAIRRALTRLLERQGCAVAAAADGDEAVRMHEEAREGGTPFQLVLLDMLVPGGLGGEVTFAELRKRDPRVRAVVMSGFSTSPVLARHREIGFLAALAKPFSFGELCELLEHLAPIDED